VAVCVHPRYEIIGDDQESIARAMQPIPVYPLSTRTDAKVTQNFMVKAWGRALEKVDELTTPVPERVRLAQGLVDLRSALRGIHRPHTMEDVQRGMEFLRFEEAFVLQTVFAQRRASDERTPAPALTADGPLQELFDQRLPFSLTPGQQQVGEDLKGRLREDHPMSVLVQGDVGSGKTVVALRAMLQAVDSGHQAVLLAPTEVLAEQHHRTVLDLMGDLAAGGRLDAHPRATTVRLLTGSSRTAARRQSLLDITSGQAGIVIGTHALLTQNVEFASLALVVVDEQHRFGVDHRRRLREKGPAGQSPHTIVMTATPIPRTAALATVGDLDLISLRDRPGQRSPVTSFAVPEDNAIWEQRMWARTGEEIAQGRQAFVVCPWIEAGSGGEAASGKEAGPEPRNVTAIAQQLAARPELPGVRIGVLHGRMTTDERQETMRQMLEHELDLLVSTTVIEVGVDIPNATVMVVLDAEHFGISQLHQLRGRVGRGDHPGIAFFASRAETTSEPFERVDLVARTSDGFALAESDMVRRGGGDLLGVDQSGMARYLRYLDVVRDAAMVERARLAAERVVQEDPTLITEPKLVETIDMVLSDAGPVLERS
jgi:ATP-dependent DNA helicase RecG